MIFAFTFSTWVLIVALVLTVLGAALLAWGWGAPAEPLPSPSQNGAAGAPSPEVTDEPIPKGVRYRSILLHEGVATLDDLRDLDTLDEVPGIGATRGQTVAKDLLASGVSPSVVPPVMFVEPDQHA